MIFYRSYYLLIVLIILSACSNEDKLVIAISKGSGHPSYENYGKWLSSSNKNIELIDLYGMSKDDALVAIEKADGLLLSGGVDVHPGRFGKPEEADKCEIDLARDTIEFTVIEKALDDTIPIFGICRGLQMLNVYQKGSLVVDLPSDRNTTIHQTPDPGDAFHDVTVFTESKLGRITAADNETVNSNHHQAIDELGFNLIPTSMSADGTVESIEWEDTTGLPWMMAVQWHPERLENKKMSKPLLDEFLKAVQSRKIRSN